MKNVTIVKTEKELGEALKRDDDMIQIEGDVANKVFKIKATGKVAWVIAIGAIGVAVTLSFGSGGAAAPVGMVIAPAAVTVLGASATYGAIAIAIAAGGVSALGKLRNNYKEISRTENSLLLARK